jgi:ABC-type polysaccharide/polyol phosphate transport system ATPase subunit
MANKPLLILEHVSQNFTHRLQSGGANIAERVWTKIVGRKQQVRALIDINLVFHEGEIVGMIGKSGAGKSTLGDIMSGLVLPTQGHVYASEEPELLSGYSHFLPRLSGARNITLMLSAHGLTDAEIDEQLPLIIKRAKLRRIIHQPLNTYTKRSRQRLRSAIAITLLPKILIADVALKAGDKVRTSELRTEVSEIAKSGGLVVLTGQRVEVLQEMCTRIIWLEKGKVHLDGSTEIVLEKWFERYPESPDEEDIREESPE